MHYETNGSPINEITVCGETIFEFDVGNGWSVTDVWFDDTVSAWQVDCIKIKLEKIEVNDTMKRNIEENKEAFRMMERATKSMEAKIREAYNKGYHDGLKDGVEQTTQKLINKMLEEVNNERSNSEDG